MSALDTLQADVMTVVSDPHLTWEQARVRLQAALNASFAAPPAQEGDTLAEWRAAQAALAALDTGQQGGLSEAEVKALERLNRATDALRRAAPAVGEAQ